MRGGNRDAEVGHTLVKTREEAAERTETAALTLAASRATGRGEPQRDGAQGDRPRGAAADGPARRGRSREEGGVGGRGVCTLTALPLLYSKNNTIKKRGQNVTFLKRKNEWRTKKTIRLIQMEILRYHLMPVRRGIIKKSTVSQAKGRGEKETLPLCFQRM